MPAEIVCGPAARFFARAIGRGHAGDATFPLSKETRAITLQDFLAALEPLR
jgi:hypothetical protein